MRGEASSYQITISLPQQSFKLGEPILAHVSLKNISSEKIIVSCGIGPHQAEVNYEITVTDESGGHVALKSSIRQHGQISKPSVFSRASVDLAPNETLEEDSVITKLFPLDKPGRYKLEFARWVPGAKNAFVRSNTITFSIVK
jgi:hypothetical protein